MDAAGRAGPGVAHPMHLGAGVGQRMTIKQKSRNSVPPRWWNCLSWIYVYGAEKFCVSMQASTPWAAMWSGRVSPMSGCRLIRKRTFARFLDAVNFPEGNPEADPNQHFSDEIWCVDRKAAENAVYLE